MPDDVAQVFAGLATNNRESVGDRENPVKVGRTGQYFGISGTEYRHKGQDLERIFGPKFVQHVLFGEIGDHKCHVARVDAQDFRDRPERIPGEGSDIVDARRFEKVLHAFAITMARLFR